MAVVGFCPHIYQERNRRRILKCRRTLGRSPEDEQPDVARSSTAFPRFAARTFLRVPGFSFGFSRRFFCCCCRCRCCGNSIDGVALRLRSERLCVDLKRKNEALPLSGACVSVGALLDGFCLWRLRASISAFAWLLLRVIFSACLSVCLEDLLASSFASAVVLFLAAATIFFFHFLL